MNMKEHKQRITQVETASVKDNQVLALSVTPQDITRCTRVIRQYGVLTPPVVGSFSDGTQLVLSGECEFLAMREMGVRRVDAFTVSITEEQEANKLSLLLSSLKKSPNALSEGMLLLKLLKSGNYTQSQLGELLGKSVSWINKRFNLLTRLEPAVREMVTQRSLCPHTAQEIARLPQTIQQAFAARVVQDGLPKSAVEVLVTAYNTESCPESFRKQILEQPRHAVERVAAVRPAKSIRKKEETDIPSVLTLRNDLVLLLRCIQEGERYLGGLSEEVVSSQNTLMLQCKEACLRFSSLLDIHLKQKKFPQGKQRRCQSMAIEWEVYRKIRQLYLVEKQSLREIARTLGVDRKTVRKYCRGGVLPDIRKASERKSNLFDTVKDEILQLLEENKTLPPKQRRNAKDIWEYLLREKGMAVAQSTIRRHVRLLRDEHPEVFIPLDHEPGESIQFDWGDMVAVLAGVKTSISVFCAALPHSGAIFAFVYPNKSTLSFLHGHIKTFESMGGVTHRCTYDNLKTAVLKGSGKEAVKQVSFKRLEAHYGFDAVFCNVASGWEKSNVENAVAIVRRIAFTPMPRVENYTELQDHVTNRCLHYLKTHTIQGREHSIYALFQKEREYFLPLPETALDMGFTTVALVQPDLTVHYEGTKYSVPHTLAGRHVTLRLTPFHLSIFHEGREIYVHERALKKNDHRYVLEHYLNILERKPRAINQARPLTQGIMPKECSEFLRLCCEPDAKQQLVEILLMGRDVEKDKLFWALRQANHTRNPNRSLIRFFLEADKAKVSMDDLEVQHRSLFMYDELLEGEKT